MWMTIADEDGVNEGIVVTSTGVSLPSTQLVITDVQHSTHGQLLDGTKQAYLVST